MRQPLAYHAREKVPHKHAEDESEGRGDAAWRVLEVGAIPHIVVRRVTVEALAIGARVLIVVHPAAHSYCQGE